MGDFEMEAFVLKRSTLHKPLALCMKKATRAQARVLVPAISFLSR